MELFRGDRWRRTFAGESRLALALLSSVMEQHLMVEIIQGQGVVVANVLLAIERFDGRGRSISSKSSLQRTFSSVDLSSGLSVSELQALPASSGSKMMGAFAQSSTAVIGIFDS